MDANPLLNEYFKFIQFACLITKVNIKMIQTTWRLILFIEQKIFKYGSGVIDGITMTVADMGSFNQNAE